MFFFLFFFYIMYVCQHNKEVGGEDGRGWCKRLWLGNICASKEI